MPGMSLYDVRSFIFNDSLLIILVIYSIVSTIFFYFAIDNMAKYQARSTHLKQVYYHFKKNEANRNLILMTHNWNGN